MNNEMKSHDAYQIKVVVKNNIYHIYEEWIKLFLFLRKNR